MTDSQYDVFLSHNSRDKGAVEVLAVLLQKHGLTPFLDKWNLVPGEPIEDGLIRALEHSESAVIFVGPAGDGPWQSEEMRDILKRAVKSHNEFRAIPVILPGGSAAALEKSFLGSRLWIEFKTAEDSDALMRLAKAIKGEAAGGDPIRLPEEPAPYRGLERFERIEKPEEDFFFGRDEEIRALVTRLVKDRFVAVIGASGSGKSSLVRAGLSKQIAEEVQPGIRRWTTITVEPGGTPFRSLAVQIAVAAGIPVAERESWLETTVEKWRASPTAVRQTLETLFAGAKEPLLVFIDQFEELFTHRSAGPDGERLARNFVANLVDLWSRGGDKVRVVVALRADFVARCLEIGPLKELLQDRTMLVGEVGDDALREIVKEPAARVGAFLEKGLMERILKDVRSGSGSLPLLQQALHGLWRNRNGAWLTHDAYTASGGVARALNDQAQAAFTRLDDAQKEIADSLFPRLITLGEGVADTRRRVQRSELYPRGVEPGAVNTVIEQLSGKEARILVTTRSGAKADDLASGEDFVEFTHEALLSNWQHLVKLLETERTSIRRHRTVTVAAAEWEATPDAQKDKFLLRAGQLVIAEQWAASQGGRARLTELEARFLKASTDERDAEEDRKAKVARRLKRLSIGALAAAAVALVIGIVAVQQMLRARKSEEKTITETIKATWRAASLVEIPEDEVSGVRGLYNRLKIVVDLKKVASFSPVPIFLSGPHGDDFNFDSNEFAHYNPEFVAWAGQHLIPAANDVMFKKITQAVYDKHVKELARTYHIAYRDLQTDPEFLKVTMAEYLTKVEQGKGHDAAKFDPNGPSLYLQNQFSPYSDAWSFPPMRSDWMTPSTVYLSVVAPGFWVRREIDGTAKDIFDLLEKLLRTYDSGFIASPIPAKSPKQRVADLLIGHWTRNGSSLTFAADGTFQQLGGAQPGTWKWDMVSPSQIQLNGQAFHFGFAQTSGENQKLVPVLMLNTPDGGQSYVKDIQ